LPEEPVSPEERAEALRYIRAFAAGCANGSIKISCDVRLEVEDEHGVHSYRVPPVNEPRAARLAAVPRDPRSDLETGRSLGVGGFVAIDFETATRSRASACAVGLALVEKGAVSHVRRWLIRPPGNAYEGFNISIHGIRPVDTENSPEFATVWREVENAIDGRTVVAHYAPFDIGVLRNSLVTAGADLPSLSYYCTRALTRQAWPGMLSYRLNDLAAACGITFAHHDPSEDARAAADLAIACCGAANRASLADASRALGVVAGRLSLTGWAPSGQISEPHRLKELHPTVDELPEHGPFVNKMLVFTGTLTCGFTRSEAAQLAVNAGGKVTETMSKKVDFLVVGMQDALVVKDGVHSGKMLKAVQLQVAGSPIEVLSEDEFLRMLHG
jgi:DNA polymerase-3 subunit epsilon